VARKAVEAALPLEDVLAAELVTLDGDESGRLSTSWPYGDDADHDWYLVSDLSGGLHAGTTGHAVRQDHVLGVGGASTTLAQLTIRDPFATALDLGTGCGVQALHLSTHVGRVTATDRNPRALMFAALTARLSGVDAFDLREGDLFGPVADDRFDLVVSNPPFVVSPDSAGDGGRFVYRDSGLPGDEVGRRLVTRARDTSTTAAGARSSPMGSTSRAGTGGARRRMGERDRLRRLGRAARGSQDPAEYADWWLRDSGEHGGPRLRPALRRPGSTTSSRTTSRASASAGSPSTTPAATRR